MNMMLDKNKINTLVIGGAGFIGSHLVPILVNSGRKVTVLGRKKIPSYRVHEGASYINGDFSDKSLIRRLIHENEEILHLGYEKNPGISNIDPWDDIFENLPPSLYLFSESAKLQRKLVFVSSGGTVYGDALSLPISESHLTKPVSSYGLIKLTLENYGRFYNETQGLRFICLRPSNAFGIGQKPYTGQGFISTCIASVIHGESVKVFGEKGSIRDYIYVADLALGIFSALESGHAGETYNIGSGIGLSNLDVVNAVCNLVDSVRADVIIEHLPERIFDVKANVLDASKLSKHTGWCPKVSFNDGLKKTIDWQLHETY